MFTQEIVDYLNRSGAGQDAIRLELNPSIHNFVTCPRVIIYPGLFDEAQRISVTDNQYGRFVTILKRDGERRYICQILNDSVTVELIENLISSIEGKGGACRIERSFLVIDLPLGYLLDIRDESLARVVVHQDKFEDIGIE